MYKLLSRSSGNVIGIQFSGKLTHAQYKEVLPIINERISEYGNIRVLLELNHFEGWDLRAALDDIFFKIKHHGNIERLALVTDTSEDEWAALVDQPFGRLPVGKEKIFKASQINKAWEWLEKGKTTILFVDPIQYHGKVRCGSNMKVLIAGTGVTGLTLGALLKARGFEPTFVSKDTKTSKHSFLVNLWPNALNILNGLGIKEEIEKASTELEDYEIFESDATPIISYKIQRIKEKYGPVRVIEHMKLKEIIADILPKKSFLSDVTIEELNQDHDQIAVVFSNGEKRSFDLVVGCDGAKSTVRKITFGKIPAAPQRMRYWYYVGDEKWNNHGKYQEYWSDNAVVTVGVIDDEIHMILGVRESECHFEDEEGALHFLRETFESFVSPIPKILKNIKKTDLKELDYKYVRLNSYVKGRVALVGDASLSTLPTSSIGAFLGIEAASVLAEELTRTNSQYIACALNKYEARRKLRYDQVKDLLDAYEHLPEERFGLISRFFKKVSEDDFFDLWDKVLESVI